MNDILNTYKGEHIPLIGFPYLIIAIYQTDKRFHCERYFIFIDSSSPYILKNIPVVTDIKNFDGDISDFTELNGIKNFKCVVQEEVRNIYENKNLKNQYHPRLVNLNKSELIEFFVSLRFKSEQALNKVREMTKSTELIDRIDFSDIGRIK